MEPVPIERLLQHRAWVRRLALAMADDTASADDLEQETWVAAMRRPPRSEGAVRSWLRRVMRNRVQQIWRTASRAERREREAARPEGGGEPPDEAVARAEAQRELVNQVFDLDEPYRTTMILRYFEELSPVETAKRLGVAPNTVRQREKRALTLLRGRLDRRYGGRVGWTVLLGVGVAQLAAPAAASSATLKTTVLASSTKQIAFGVAVAAVILSGFALWQHLGSAAAPAPRTTGAPEDGTRGLGPGTDGDPATPPGAGAGDEAGPDGHGAILLSGEVRFARGDTPAADHAVALDGPDGRETVRTDSAGYFAFARLAAGGPYDLSVAAPGCATARVTGTVLRAGERRHLETLWLDRPLTVRARVLDPRGDPVAGARVEAFRARRRAAGQDWAGRPPRPEAKAASGKDGIAVLAGVAPGRWTFRATHPEFAAAGVAERPLLRGGATIPIELALQSGYALRGRIVDPQGEPLKDSVVLALRPREAADSMQPFPIDPLRVETRTDADGRYEFPRLSHGGHSIAVVPEGGLECRIGVVEVPAVEVFDVRLDGGLLLGRVTDLDTGEPLAGAEVRGGFWRRHHPTFFSAVSDDDGRYRIVVPLGGYLHPPARGGRARPINLDVTKPGYVLEAAGDHMQWNSVFPLRGAEVRWDFRMRRAATLDGVVRGPEGPVPGARVTIDVWNGFRGLVARTAVTRGDGRYRVDGILAGRAMIRVEKPGYFQDPAPLGDWLSGEPAPPGVTVEIPESGAARLDATLRRGVTLEGRVAAEDGAPVAAARVGATWAGAAPVETATGADGGFAFASVRPGVPVRVIVRADGFQDLEREATAGERLTLEMTPAGHVAGRVLARGGGTPDGVFVQVAPAREVFEGSYEVASVWQRAARHAVAPDGVFRVPLADGNVAVLVRAVAPGFAPAVSEPVRAGGDARIVLEPGHVLRGVVVAADGSGPLAGVRVEFSNERLPPALGQRRDWSGSGFSQHPFEILGVTKEDGTFQVKDLPAFTYRLRVTSPHHGMAQPTVRVPADGPVRVELAMPADIAGRVAFDDGAPVAWVLVRAHAPGGGFTGIQDTTDEDGRFELRAWVDGPFRLEVRQDWRTPVDVVPFLTEEAYATGRDDVALTVRRGAGSITGRCTAYGGEGVPGAWIHVRAAEGGGPVFTTRANARGEYTVTGLVAESVRLRAFGGRTLGGPERFNQPLVVEAGPVRAGSAGIDLELLPAKTITGRVLGPDGAPVAGGFAVRARYDDAWGYDGAVGADGTFTVKYLLPRTYGLTLLDDRTGREIPLAGAPRVRAGAEEVELRVRATRAIEGDVVDAAGRPVPGADVYALARGEVCGADKTDLEGRFRLSGLREEHVLVVARHHTLGRLVRDGVAAGTTGLRLRLEPQPPLVARLVDNAGAPLRRAAVELVHESGGPRARVETDAEGRLATRALPPGTYRVAVVARGGRPLPEPVACGTIRSGNPEVVLRVE